MTPAQEAWFRAAAKGSKMSAGLIDRAVVACRAWHPSATARPYGRHHAVFERAGAPDPALLFPGHASTVTTLWPSLTPEIQTASAPALPWCPSHGHGCDPPALYACGAVGVLTFEGCDCPLFDGRGRYAERNIHRPGCDLAPGGALRRGSSGTETTPQPLAPAAPAPHAAPKKTKPPAVHPGQRRLF
jgi:hypothetical protein